MVGIHQAAAAAVCALFRRARVHMDFGAGAAGAGVAHLPEIVLLIAE